MRVPKRFLVVDDDPINNRLCDRIIRKKFPDVDIKLFENPELALSFIEEEYMMQKEFHTFLFLDINMPSMTGWEFLEKFETFDESIHNQFTINILSSSVDERDIEKASSNGFVSGFQSKPLMLTRLHEIFPE